MDENNNKEKNEFSVDIDKEELKNQTKDTVNQVKETMKNVDFKKEAGATKTFALELISKPFSTIQDIITEKENRFSNAIMLMICYMVASGLYGLIYLIKYSSAITSFILSIVSPLIFVLAITVAIVILGGKEKKNITTILSGLIVANSPRILSELISAISLCAGSLRIIVYISTILQNTISFIAIALTFIVIKGVITAEDDDKVIRKTTIIMLVAYAILKVLTICGLY